MVCGVSAPGGQGHSLGGCWQVCSPDDISSQYWSFYSWICGPAYSGELGRALCTRACVCSAWGWWLEGWREDANRDWGSRRTAGLWDSLVMTDVSSGEWTQCRYTAVPASNILHSWPCLPLWNIWRAGTDLVRCGQMARLEMALSSLEWLDPELDKDGLVVIIQETSVKDNVTPRCD